jgi:hypothetical protein
VRRVSVEIETNPEYLTYALTALPLVNNVSYEFPGVWHIQTEKGTFYLGTANGKYGWDDGAEIAGETDSETVGDITLDFEQFITELTKENN